MHDPGPLTSGLAGRRISPELVSRFPAMIAELRTMDDVAGGGTVFSLARHEFDLVANLLDHATYGEPTGRALHHALAELGQLAGWCAYDAGQPRLAQRYYIAGLRAAQTADARPIGAHIPSCMAEQAACEGKPADAVTLIHTALAGTRGQQVPRLLAELHIRQAFALAAMGDAPSCTTAIAKARMHVEPQDDDPLWLYWVSSADITAFAGNCLLQLGQADRAAPLLEEGVELFGKSFLRDRQLYSVHLATALARPGPQRDLEVAANRGMAAIDLSESLDSARGVHHLRDLWRQMEPHSAVPVVHEFLDRARVFLAA